MSAALSTVTVIGGGVVGCTIAYRLAARGVNVTLVEREAVGAGATGASGGHVMVWPEDDNDVRVDLDAESCRLFRRFLPDIKERSGIDPHDQELTFFFPAIDEKEALHLRGLSDRVAAAGVTVEWIDAATALELEPRLSPDMLGGVLNSECVQLGGYQFVEALTKAAVRSGAQVLTDEAVGLWRKGDHVTGVALRKGIDISCDTVVLAMGPWTGPLASEWIEALVPVNPYSLQRLRLKGLDQPLATSVHWRGINMTSRRDGLIHAGSIYDPAGFDAVPGEEARATILENVSVALPGLRYEVVEDRVATASQTPDEIPLVGPVEALEGVYLAVPADGGFTMSAVMAEALTLLLTEGREHPLLAPMLPERAMPQPVSE